MKKMLLTCLSLSVFSSGLFAGTTAYASENVETANIDTEETVNYQVETTRSLPMSTEVNRLEANDGNITIQSVPTYVSKKTLRWAIKNTTSITNVVGKYFGKTAAKNVGSVMHSYVKPVLRKLEALDKVTYGKLEDAIYDAIKGPLGSVAGKIGAKAIVEVISIISPI